MNDVFQKEELKIEPALELINDLLCITRDEYTRALNNIYQMDKRKLKSLLQREMKINDYRYIASEYRKTKYRKIKTDEDLEIIALYKKHRKPKSFNKIENKMLRKYYRSVKVINECEEFYKSKRFRIFTMNTIDGESVIKYYRRMYCYGDY